MSERDLIVRLARACAHGIRQKSFINELLIDEGFVAWDMPRAPFCGGYPPTYYGTSRLTGSSWKSLKKRLTEVGFIVTYGPEPKKMYDPRKIQLRFSV